MNKKRRSKKTKICRVESLFLFHILRSNGKFTEHFRLATILPGFETCWRRHDDVVGVPAKTFFK